MIARYVLVLFFLVGSSLWSAATMTNISHVVDGIGSWSSGGSYSNLSAVAQPGGVSVSSAGTMINSAGFLNTFVLNPSLDTDGDGLSNELDSDNDNDGLDDNDELAGSGFNPVTITDVNAVDTDGDGMSDGSEAVAGTDPTDNSASLQIVSIEPSGDDLIIGWQARSGNSYRVGGSFDLIADPDFNNDVVHAVLVTNAAAPPWYVTTNYYRHVGASTNMDSHFYIIEAK